MDTNDTPAARRSDATLVLVRFVDGPGATEVAARCTTFRQARRWVARHMFEGFSTASVQNIPGTSTWYVDFT